VGFAIDAALSNVLAVMEAREKMSSTPIVEVGDMWGRADLCLSSSL
jgi:hypothetical protein